MRPLVWRVRFRAYQDDPPIEAGVAKPGGDRVPRGTAADDYCLRSSSRNLRSDQTR